MPNCSKSSPTVAICSRWFCVSVLVWPASAVALEQTLWPTLQTKAVNLVANDWCPQHCEDSTTHKGYVVDIVSQALALEGVNVSLRFVPWSRALMMVQRGEADGVLTPTVPGFPQFLYPDLAVGYPQYCFYVDAASHWKYRQYSDLQGKRVALLADSGLGALDDYLKANKSTITVHLMVGEHDYANRLFNFLTLKRTDTVVITSDVFNYEQARDTLSAGFKSAGCLPSEKMAVGLSKSDAKRSKTIGLAIDSGIIKLRKSGKLSNILAQYGMVDWALHPERFKNAHSTANPEALADAITVE